MLKLGGYLWWHLPGVSCTNTSNLWRWLKMLQGMPYKNKLWATLMWLWHMFCQCWKECKVCQRWYRGKTLLFMILWPPSSSMWNICITCMEIILKSMITPNFKSSTTWRIILVMFCIWCHYNTFWVLQLSFVTKY
jgi:hypothetical protein